jgi:hypothetical protein
MSWEGNRFPLTSVCHWFLASSGYFLVSNIISHPAGSVVSTSTFSQGMKRSILLVLALMVLLPAAFLLFMRFSVVAGEGYPTWEAVRNMLIRDGEIVITLPRGASVVSAHCDEEDSDVSIDGRTVTTKIGYSWCLITINADIDGKPHTLQFNPQKLNNWNRMRFLPVDPDDPFSDFTKFENGVEKPNSDLTRKQTATSILTPDPPRVQLSLTHSTPNPQSEPRPRSGAGRLRRWEKITISCKRIYDGHL